MPKTARTSRWAVCAATLLVLGVTALFLEIGSVLAIPSMQTAFIAKYPELRDTQLNSCTTCHMPAKKDFMNNYAIALKEAKMDFAKIEELDSDGDGATNIEEIKNERFPGSQATFPEYFVFRVDFSKDDPELGKVHFNHEMHTVKESFLSKGRCANCHSKDLFPKEFSDEQSKSMRHVAHQVCWRCHETSGSKLSPKDCTGCHTGVKDILDDIKDLLK